jgi:HK97 gp10 family phage protein
MSSQPVKGLDATLAVLSAFLANLQRNALSRGMRAAGNVVRDEARLRAPKETGKLAKAIKTGSPRKLENGVHSIRVRLDGEHSFLGIFHEYGVRPHYITAGEESLSPRKLTQRARRDGQLSDGSEGSLIVNGKHVRGAILHPGLPAQPFMRPALDIKGEEAVEALAEAVRDFVENKTGFRA